MVQHTTSSKFLDFVSKITGSLSDYNRADLESFLETARNTWPALVPLIRECLELVAASYPNHSQVRRPSKPSPAQPQRGTDTAALTAVLGSRELFPTNASLVDFARQILPHLPVRRFDKMSREKIIATVLTSLQQLDKRQQGQVYSAIRDAIERLSPHSGRTAQSFFSQWENIIKRG